MPAWAEVAEMPSPVPAAGVPEAVASSDDAAASVAGAVAAAAGTTAAPVPLAAPLEGLAASSTSSGSSELMSCLVEKQRSIRQLLQEVDGTKAASLLLMQRLDRMRCERTLGEGPSQAETDLKVLIERVNRDVVKQEEVLAAKREQYDDFLALCDSCQLGLASRSSVSRPVGVSGSVGDGGAAAPTMASACGGTGAMQGRAAPVQHSLPPRAVSPAKPSEAARQGIVPRLPLCGATAVCAFEDVAETYTITSDIAGDASEASTPSEQSTTLDSSSLSPAGLGARASAAARAHASLAASASQPQLSVTPRTCTHHILSPSSSPLTRKSLGTCQPRQRRLMRSTSSTNLIEPYRGGSELKHTLGSRSVAELWRPRVFTTEEEDLDATILLEPALPDEAAACAPRDPSAGAHGHNLGRDRGHQRFASTNARPASCGAWPLHTGTDGKLGFQVGSVEPSAAAATGSRFSHRGEGVSQPALSRCSSVITPPTPSAPTPTPLGALPCSWGQTRSAAALLGCSPPPPVSQCIGFSPPSRQVVAPAPIAPGRRSMSAVATSEVGPTSGGRSPQRPAQPSPAQVAHSSRPTTPARGSYGGLQVAAQVSVAAGPSAVGGGNGGRCSPIRRDRAPTPTCFAPRNDVWARSAMMRQSSERALHVQPPPGGPMAAGTTAALAPTSVHGGGLPRRAAATPQHIVAPAQAAMAAPASWERAQALRR
eukprot:TRINITY_DN25433_c0_g1_i1.p1 TRINITY_DN25433_c0_g1~~TRINITY_DN25433_c0_g1_i1.p1  ORF type:complete len:711 (-),score=122.76 TRINITY_DN25433_c0_g1_i1:209-2341(-)